MHSTAAIFVNYRREDSSGYAGRLFDRLKTRYGADSVFWDISGSIEPGVPFPEAIERAIVSCGAVLAVVGPEWLTCVDSKGRRRIDDPDDFVRLEVSKALRRGVRVIPVLVQGAAMPAAADLPDDLKQLAQHQAVELSDGRWDYDVSQLLVTLDKVLNRQPKNPRSIVPIAIGAVAVLALAIAGVVWMRQAPSVMQAPVTQPAQSSGGGGSTAPAPTLAEPVNRPAPKPSEAKPPVKEPAGEPESAVTPTPATPATMPDLRGRSLAEAQTLMTRAGLRIGRISYLSAADIPAGSVAGSSAPAGVNVRPEASVAIYLAEEPVQGLHAWGMLPIEGSGFTADLDASGGRDAPDIRFLNEQVFVLNGAQVIGVGPIMPNLARCTRVSARMSSTPVLLRGGICACVQTSEGRLAAVGIEGDKLKFETFAPSSSARPR